MTKIMIRKSLAVRLHGCYEPERVAALFGNHESMTALRWCDRADVPAKDRIWALCHWGILSDGVLRLIACYWAEQILLAERRAGRESNKKLWDAISVSRRFVRVRATTAEMAAASDAAWTAASNAAWTAASDAASDAAWAWQLECLKIQIKFEEG